CRIRHAASIRARLQARLRSRVALRGPCVPVDYDYLLSPQRLRSSSLRRLAMGRIRSRLGAGFVVLGLLRCVFTTRAPAQAAPPKSRGGARAGSGDSAAQLREALEAHRAHEGSRANPSPPSGTDEALDPRPDAQCETYLAIDPNDEQHVVGVAIDFSPGYRIIRWYTSFDGGASWATDTIPLESDFAWEADPTVVITPSGIPVMTL